MESEITLRKLAILYVQKQIDGATVKKALQMIEPAVKKSENTETWYEGEPDNTITAVQALIGSEITQEDFNNFVKLLD